MLSSLANIINLKDLQRIIKIFVDTVGYEMTVFFVSRFSRGQTRNRQSSRDERLFKFGQVTGVTQHATPYLALPPHAQSRSPFHAQPRPHPQTKPRPLPTPKLPPP